ncbi:C-type lectin lectoxin-Thr1-like [Branchiostoma floridae x Branchiostoma japonicum]
MRYKATWHDAAYRCRRNGAYLASITSKEENYFIKGLISNAPDKGVWIGLRKNGRAWKWNDGSRFSYQNWDHGEPNNDFWNGGEDCVNIWSKTGKNWTNTLRWTYGKWNDNKCKETFPYICEKSK